jgi:TolB-like protein/DNA-binding SARP family transcriptional activator
MRAAESPHLRFTTLGSVQLEDASGAAVRKVPRRVWALLIRLTLARGEPVSRDQLCFLLWDNRDPERGRHRLSDSLSILRRALGEGALETPGDQVRLRPERLRCDAGAFEEAVAQERWVEAVEIWKGPFLEGFFFRGIPEFERWAEAERERLGRLHVRAIEGRAAELEEARDVVAAADAWARLAALESLDSRIALRHLRALARAGNAAGALQQAKIHTALLHEELGIEPDEAFRDEVERIRAGQVAPFEAPPARTDPVPVEPPAVPPPAVPASIRVSPVRQSPSRSRRGGRRAVASVSATLALVGLLAAGYFHFRPAPSLPGEAGASQVGPAQTIVAVLPFENLSSDPENEFFAGGIHEEILTQLSGIAGIGVISRMSVLEYRDAPRNLREIAERLGADVVLEGSVQRADGRVRITAQLIDARRDLHLWAERYDRVLDDIFAIQTDVARQVASVLQVALTAADAAAIERRPTEDLQAYDHYLRGLSRLRGGFGAEGHRAAVESFQRAVERDPGFSLAWAQLSLAHGRMHWFVHDRRPGRADESRSAAERALALAPELPEVKWAMGDLLYRAHRYEESLAYLEPAYRQRPGDATLAAALAAAYRRLGRWEESNRLWERAMELDPLSGVWPMELAASLMILGRYAEADPLLERAIALAPEQGFWPYWMRARIHLLGSGDAAAARRVLESSPLRYHRQLAELRLFVDVAEGRLEEGLAQLRSLPAEVEERPLFIAPRELLEADYLSLLGRQAEARERYTAARTDLLARLRERPDDYGLQLRLARTSAALGLRNEARTASRRAAELLPLHSDAYWGQLVLLQREYVSSALGEVDEAVTLLERLLDIPSFYSPAWLPLDPYLKPLHGHPRFERLARPGSAWRASLVRLPGLTHR